MQKSFVFTTKIAYFVLSLIPIFSYAADTITFPNACAQGETLTIAAVGDVLIHTPLRKKGAKLGFDTLWEEAIPYFKSADIAYANLEGPIAPGIAEPGSHGKGNIYTDFPYFNYPPALAHDLKKSGISIVSTANNHALDRYAIGIDKTIDSLDQANLPYVGTRARGSSRDWFYIMDKKGFKIAWISCTEFSNDNPDPYKQVLFCYKRKDRQLILDMIQKLKHEVDAIIVVPHWGEENHHHPNEEQIYFARQVLNAGALAVIGSHPHVLQPMQKYITKDGRATFIIYSLGNFVSHQGDADQRSTVILLLGLTKTLNGTIINGVRYVPMYMQNHCSENDLYLKCLKDQADMSPSTISRVMPLGNRLDTDTLITNPECNTQEVFNAVKEL